MSAPRTHAGAADAAASLWFGADTVYIRAGQLEGREVFVICDPEGAELAAAPTRELAFAVARQNDREPLSVH